MQLLALPQLVAAGEVAARPLLPSLRYHPADGELAATATQLPWPDHATAAAVGAPAGVIGEFARELGAKTPGRLVVSAKSWLSHAGVDRSAAILPWGAADGVAKISPLAASASYLALVRAAWDQQFPDYPLAGQEVVLTLPASFDASARELTVEAAQTAGIERLALLEEPQAACYDWLYRQHDDLEQVLDGVRLLLVCDVGGGTTDLTLIQVEAGEPLRLTRVGVGDHLMLGGDNMDLALARQLEPQFGGKLSGAELAQLIQQCQRAKERLLSADAPSQLTVTLLGGGSRLVGAARSAVLEREQVLALALDGFFPQVAATERPLGRRAAIVEFGLPYVADAAVTRHLAAFLGRYAEAADGATGTGAAIAMPDAVLFNGGVFRGAQVSERLLQVLGGWRGAPPRRLLNADPDLAVARGAVAYALARRGKGLKIGGGSARSYFLLLDGSSDNGEPAARQAVCILPRGSEEGRERVLGEGVREFALRIGQPVRFHLSSSTSAKRRRAGDLVTIDTADDDFEPLPPVATVLSAKASTDTAEAVPVRLVSGLTEVGTLALRCEARDDSERSWRLEFQLRGAAAGRRVDPGGDVGTKVHPRFAQAADLLAQYYGGRSKTVEARAVKTLRADLEKILGKRDNWDSALARELFDVLLDGQKRRRRSPDHERLWFNLAGFCLRPGFGYPLDDWRVDQLWPLFAQGVQHVKEAQLWAEWWTLWRRVAGGLDADRQTELLDDVQPYLRPPSKNTRIKGVRKQGYDDMVRLAASLEQLAAARKAEIGDYLLQRLGGKNESVQGWWALGRLGARVPFHGSAHAVVDAERAAEWLRAVLNLDWQKVQPAAFAATLLARLSGDRERDLDAELRADVSRRLRHIDAPSSWRQMVSEVVALEADDEQRVFGESLPSGLTLVER